PCAPISHYGDSKVRQEGLLEAFARSHQLPYLVGRISNIYGPNQNMTKSQGLISQLLRCVIQNRPFHLYVPLDTIRDFLYVEDCAESIAATLTNVRARAAGGATKLFVSEESTALSRVVHTVAAVTRRRPRLVLAADPRRALQPPALRFRSIEIPEASK